MNPNSEVQSQVETPASSLEGIQPGLEARSEAMEAVAQARESLGNVAARPFVQANGEVVTQRDRDEELRIRQIQGHGYQR
jgi:hypothetical protein